MDKLSIYELLSFIVPGYVATKVIEYYLTLYGIALPFPIDGTLDDNLVMLVVATILGVAIHVLTFRVINHPKLKWMKAWIYRPESEYIKNSKGGELPMIMNAVKQIYENDKDHSDENSTFAATWKQFNKEKNELEEKTKEVIYYNWTFDFAYYYLEVNDKITQAKNFQSLYFLFRNLFVMSILHLKILVLMVLASLLIPEMPVSLSSSTAYTIIFLALLTWLLVIITDWLRGKMIYRVIWSYYVDRQIHKIDNKNKI